MPLVKAGDVELRYEQWGDGDIPVVFLHGNLGCGDWMNLVWPHLPDNLRVVTIEWRGCGGSDKPLPDRDFLNYSIDQHAQDMLAAIAALDIERTHLCGHSTGGIIALKMLVRRPAIFDKVLLLDPVGPMGLQFDEQHRAVFQAMKDSADTARQVMATAMPTLFDPIALADGRTVFAEEASTAQRVLFNTLVEKTRTLSDGIWFGTIHNLTKEWQGGELRELQEDIVNETLVLWGELDRWIPREHVEEMARRMPNCRLEIVPGVGHSMNVERPEGFAHHFARFFLGERQAHAAPFHN